MTAATGTQPTATQPASDVDVGDTVTNRHNHPNVDVRRHYRRSDRHPDQLEVGSHAVTITATDVAGATATDTFTVVVANTNDAPTVSTGLVDASVDEDSSYSLDASSMCTDVDVGDSYTMSGALIFVNQLRSDIRHTSER